MQALSGFAPVVLEFCPLGGGQRYAVAKGLQKLAGKDGYGVMNRPRVTGGDRRVVPS
jgi:hypothetical protein